MLSLLSSPAWRSRETASSQQYWMLRRMETVIPLTGEIVRMARFHELAYSLSPQDALVLASVRAHAENEVGPKCFVSQDVKGFANPTVYDELSATECRVLANFTDAVAYIKSSFR